MQPKAIDPQLPRSPLTPATCRLRFIADRHRGRGFSPAFRSLRRQPSPRVPTFQTYFLGTPSRSLDRFEDNPKETPYGYAVS
jgi:hypothetical protein